MRIISTKLRTLSARIFGSIPVRPLGKTGLKVPILGMGGESLLKIQDKEAEALELLETAYELGIRYYDTASSYDNSETRIGKALSGVRNEIILATKTAERTRDGAWRDLEQSLTRLKTDHIDIWQIHHIDDSDEVKTVMGPDGALTALKEAKKQGIIRFLGITGHYDPNPILEALKEHSFDTILVSLNAADVHHRSFIRRVLPEAVKQSLGIVGMKVCCRGRIFDPTHLNNMKDALDYVLTLPISCAIVGHDNIEQLIGNVKIVKEFQPLNRNQMDDLENKTKDYANLALFFRKDNEEFNPFWESYPEIKRKSKKSLKNHLKK